MSDTEYLHRLTRIIQTDDSHAYRWVPEEQRFRLCLSWIAPQRLDPAPSYGGLLIEGIVPPPPPLVLSPSEVPSELARTSRAGDDWLWLPGQSILLLARLPPHRRLSASQVRRLKSLLASMRQAAPPLPNAP